MPKKSVEASDRVTRSVKMTDNVTNPAVLPPVATLDPNLAAMLQFMQNQMAEQQRMQERTARQQEQTIKALTDQVAALSTKKPNGNPKSNHKMEKFDLNEDKWKFRQWKARFETHVAVLKLVDIEDPAEKKLRIYSEMEQALSSDT